MNLHIFGQWKKQNGTTWDILDGFKVSTGPILITDQKGKISIGTWQVKNDNNIIIKIGYTSRKVSSVNQTTLSWGKKDILSKTSGDVLLNKVFLKKDSKNFINKLINSIWSNSKLKSIDFSTTFSNESGVISTIDYNLVSKPIPWSIGSNILKISSTVIVDAFITEDYLVGLTSRDKFIVYKKIGI